MKSNQGSESRQGTVRFIVMTTLRAVRSALVISAVAFTVFVLRGESIRWSVTRQVAEENYPRLAMIFIALLAWEFWFQARKRRSAAN